MTSVGVAMATYNGARFVEQQLVSILQQTTSPDRIVVSDDASDDDTIRLIEKVTAGASVAVEIIRNTERVGAVRNFERALRRSTSDVVFLCDQDDVWRPDKITQLMHFLDADSTAALVFSNGRVVDSEGMPVTGTLWQRTGFDRHVQRACRGRDAFGVFLRRTVAPGASMAVRQDLLVRAFPLPTNAWHDDWLMLLASADGRVAFLDAPLIDYRLHADNAVGLVNEPALGKLTRRTTGGRRVGLARDVARLRELHARLEALELRSPLAQVQQAEAHALRRLETAGQPWAKTVRAVATGWRRGDYRAYSNGWRSVLADLVDGRLQRQDQT